MSRIRAATSQVTCGIAFPGSITYGSSSSRDNNCNSGEEINARFTQRRARSCKEMFRSNKYLQWRLHNKNMCCMSKVALTTGGRRS